MTIRSIRVAALTLAAALMSVRASQAQPSRPPASQGIDRGAIAALNKMGTYLRTLKAFRIEARTTLDEVLDNGQKVQHEGTVDELVRIPNGLFAHISGDQISRMLFYDGKTFTLYGDRIGYYAVAAAPPTLGQLAEHLEQRLDIPLPLADLFLWGTEKSAVNQIRSATDVGPSAIDGTDCEHYAFRQEGLDWQIWIQQGNNPLPRKLILTTLDDEARPEYSSTMRWDLAPAYNDEAFTFFPPKDARRIIFAADRGSR